MKRKSVRIVAGIGGLVLFVAALTLLWRPGSGERAAYPVFGAEKVLAGIALPDEAPLPYLQWIRSEEYAALRPAEGVEATVLAVDYAEASPEALVERRSDRARGADVLDWSRSGGWVEWRIEVPRDGIYELELDYAPLKGGFSPVVRGVQIDGAFPFAEAERIGFSRLWKDSVYPYERNAIGNEIRPVQEERTEWRAERAANDALSSEPLRWALTAGEHALRLVGGQGAMSLHSIKLVAPREAPAYADYIRAQAADESGGEPWHRIVEAERYAFKSSVSIQLQSKSEPYISPDPQGKIVYNAIGGTSWTKPGERIGWEVAVPRSGFYAIDVKSYQGFNGRSSVFRTVRIDGSVPFREMQSYRFSPNRSMEISSLSDAQGQPYLFYLTEGKHLIEMVVDTSAVRPVTESLLDIGNRLLEIERDIRAITGNYGYGADQNLDTARTWDLRKFEPELEAELRRIVDRLQDACDYLNGLHQADTDSATALRVNADRLERLLDRFNDIPNRVTVFETVRISLNTWIQTIESQAMELDYLVVRTPDADPGLKVPDSWSKARYSAADFFRSFFHRYDATGAGGEDALTVWVQRGKDYVDLLELMIQQDFTPRTGIRVNVNLMPNTNVLLLGNVAGDQPDVALGVPLETPVDFAMRGAAEELSGYPGFEEVLGRFNPGLMRSYRYKGGVYGLPETQNYYMMFYRTDIFEDLGLAPPDTWDDVARILPTLQENGLTFNLPKKNFHIPFYQQGGEFYKPDGLQPDLTSEAGVAAFKSWTDWYRKFNLPKDIPVFIHHFRNGSIPIGVADFDMYIQLVVGAPEIEGKWKMVPLPGIRQPDGTVARWSHNESLVRLQEPSSLLVLNKSERKDEAWRFVEWWTSADVQSRFSSDIESFAGIAYRWNTANLEAMQTIPWPEEDLAALNEQDRWVKNMPYVPGYYYLAREIEFAWNLTVLGEMPAREALEKSDRSLAREMARKQEELGIAPGEHLTIAPYDKPYERRAP
ncbi:extracellular solute-binding protein [Cohnella hongkongensis]|uniref:Extracellular solute-binding protein n=1 Tax=Cohnella hongkongensis TaxID=178337 RepID=A0ABV9FFY7_9BACL